MKGLLIASLLLFFSPIILKAQATPPAELPKEIRELAAGIRGKGPDEVRAAMEKQFGPPQRNVGSGVRIGQWDVAGGTLTFHPLSGPVFTDPKGKTRHRLLRTRNPAGDNLLRGYEMTTRPDPAHHGTRFWLGNVKFGPGAAYQFTDSGANQSQRGGQENNFFLLHPAGTVEVRHEEKVTPETLLETLPEGAVVARLTFTANSGAKATFSIACSEQGRCLTFEGDQALPFCMDTSWKNFWK